MRGLGEVDGARDRPRSRASTVEWSSVGPGARDHHGAGMAISKSRRDRLRKLIKGIDIAMFTTYGEAGFPVSRPLSTQEAEFDGETLWFFTRGTSPKVREIRRNPKVNVAYASKDRNVYISVAGKAAIVDEQTRIDEFWNDALKAFFPRGRTDPNLVLIRVDVATVEYWEGPSTGVGKLIAFVVARVRKDDSSMGENRMIRMKGRKPAARKPAARKPARGARPRKRTAAKRTTRR
jgi:general stress protein 26